MLTDLGLCSRALLKIGCQTIAAFDDGTAEAEVAANLYAPLRDALLSRYPWSFATGQTSLARLVATPVADFDYAYQLPGDFLRILSAGDEGSGRGRGLTYRIQERRLHADADSVVLTYVFRPDEATFPAYFDQALIALLAAEFVLPLTESATRAQLMYGLAEKAERAARLADAQGQTAGAIENFPLTDVR